MFLKFFGKIYVISDETQICEFIFNNFKLQKLEYFSEFLTPNIIEIRIKCEGGKGGFGRALKQEGERRSRRLPHFKDSCRTLSGKRIGVIKAKRRIAQLKNQIKETEKKVKEQQENKRKSNIEKEHKLLEEKEKEVMKSAQETVQYIVQNPAKSKEVKNNSLAQSLDLSEFLED